MKEKITLLQKDDKIYIRSVDVKRLSGTLNCANIPVHKTLKGKHTGAPRYYINLAHTFKLLQALNSEYTVTFL